MSILGIRGLENVSKKKRFIEKKYIFSQMFRLFEKISKKKIQLRIEYFYSGVKKNLFEVKIILK